MSNRLGGIIDCKYKTSPVVVRAGMVVSPNASNKASEHLPDRQGDKWLAPKLFEEKEKKMSISTSPWQNFAVNCLKKNLDASRPSEHPPVRRKNVETSRWDHRLQIQNLFMAFKRVPLLWY